MSHACKHNRNLIHATSSRTLVLYMQSSQTAAQRLCNACSSPFFT
ncbi:hypothetical protein Tsp_07858 [Trichinella spiralis]|nr:hypothetical protein Tsp_07858 [Trichinella spiralis]